MKFLAPLLAAAMLVACKPETIEIAHRELSGQDAESSDAASDDEGGAALDGGARDAEPENQDALADGACKTASECGEDSYCDKQQRDAVYGTCELRPTVCPSTQAPFCGSDDISYFNDCIRKKRGVAFATSGECGRNARPCGDLFTPSECPAGTFCGRLKVASLEDPAVLCPLDIVATPGKCWALPDCSTVPDGGGRWVPCLPPVSATFGGGSPGGAGEPGPGAGGGSFGGGGSGGSFGGGSGPPCIDTCRAIESQMVHVELLHSCTR
jgi:hypothetical protein